MFNVQCSIITIFVAMNENRRYLNQFAMMMGTYMGVFWIAKFCLVPMGLTHIFLMLLFIGLTLCVPFMAYYYTKLYRDRLLGGGISFMHAWLFTTSMFIYASLLTAVAHYVYLEYIDNGYILDTYNGMLNELKAEQIPGTEAYINQIREGLNQLATMSSIELVIQQLSNNIFFGMVWAIITALIVRKNVPNVPNQEEVKQ